MADQVMTQEQVLAQLRTRGYETGGFRSPLRHFRGRLDSITGAMVQRGEMTAAKLEVTYNFSELEVYEASQPYPFPIAQISLMHSNRDKSGMGVLGASMDKILNSGLDPNTPQAQARNQDALVGVVQEWKMTPGHMMWDVQKKEETPREAWEVQWADGFGGTPHSGVATSGTVAPTATVTATASGLSASQKAIALLDGKTQAQWNSIVFQDAQVKSDAKLINSIIQDEFIPGIVEAGLVSKDANGVFHKIG